MSLMEQVLAISNLKHTDLDMYQCGTEACKPDYYYGPAVRDHFLIHYIHSGRGRFCVGDKTYHLQAGQGFLICPDIITYYQADPKEPWHYSWVGFHGLGAENYLRRAGLSLEEPIFSCKVGGYIDQCFKQMNEAMALPRAGKTRLLGYLYLFLSQLIEQNGEDHHSAQSANRKEAYVKKAIEYIVMNYTRKVSIDELSRSIGLDRSYLGSIFKEQVGISPQEYLIRFRINRACELMKNDTLTIGDISRSVGYEDPLLFSKLFKKHLGLSPTDYRKSNEMQR
ncbi:MAG: AraC family transcriptional regulator [Clostridiaceae bacterium]|nr:AraC family transcriptional regulator [Clostridiaceae bacterium]